MNRIRLAIFPDHAAAEPARQGLAQAGIPAEIHDELQLERLWFVSKSSAGVRLEVPLRHFQRSTQLLLEWDAVQGMLRDAVRCPECGSLRVDFPQFTRKSLFTNLALGLMAELRLIERQFYCEDCHCMWSKQIRPHRQRSHLAPNYFVEDIEPVSEPQTHESSERKAA